MNTVNGKGYMNQMGYSDVNPFEIVRVVSDKCVEIRPMDYEKDSSWKPEVMVGGFCGHVVNQNEQRWFIKSNPENQVVKVRLHKNGKWYSKEKAEYSLAEKPRKFYDYNF